MESVDINLLLEERQKTHGDFETNAFISQKIKTLIRSFDGFYDLSDTEKEAFDMIALKMSRILSGNSSHPDHWDDISGYAKIAQKD